MNLPPKPPRLKRRGFRRFRLQFTVALLAAIPLGLATGGCMRSEPRADLVIVNGIEPETLDPALVQGIAEMRIVTAMFEGLTRLNPKTALPEPGLAHSWDISPDGRTYTFHLRTNLVWSTGEPITAEDVRYSWIRALDPATASNYAGQLFYLTNAEDFNAGKIKDPNQVGVHVLDKFTVRVQLNSPTAYFLDLCAFQTLCVVPRRAIEKYGDNWLLAKPLPSDGPYEMIDWRINDKVRLRKNPKYWDAANTRTEVVDFLPIGSATTALNLFQTGVADVVWDKDLVPVELLDILLKKPDFHSYTILGTYFIRCNTTRKPFDDPRVRKALWLAIDRERITKKIMKAGEVAAFQFTPPGIGHYHNPTNGLLGYDPAAARKLLADAGYPGGKGFPRFSYMFNAATGGAAKVHEKVAVEMQQMLHDELGIEMELHQVEWSVYLADETKLDYELSRASWIGDYNDPDTFLNMFMANGGNNRTGWKNAHYDELIRAAGNETDPAKREKLLQEAEMILIHDEVPVIPLFFYVGFNYYHVDQVHGIYQNILDNHPLNAIWKEKPKSGADGKEQMTASH